MQIILWVFLAILGLAIALLLFTLFSKLKYRLVYINDGKKLFSLKLSYLCGLVRVSAVNDDLKIRLCGYRVKAFDKLLNPPDEPPDTKDEGTKDKELKPDIKPDIKKKRRKKPKANKLKQLQGYMKHASSFFQEHDVGEVVSASMLLMRRVVRRLWFKRLYGSLHYSLGRADKTGLSLGLLGIVLVNTRHNIHVEPDFGDKFFINMRLTAMGHVRPWGLLYPGLRYIFTPCIKKIWRPLLSNLFKKQERSNDIGDRA